MHYCFVSAQFLPQMGGVEQYTWHLGKTLLKKGHQVSVITSLKKGLKKQEMMEGIFVCRIPCADLAAGRLPVSWSLKQVKDCMEKLKPDRVIVQTRLYTLSWLGLQAAQDLKIPAIVIEHGTSYVTMSSPYLQKAEIFYEKWLLKKVKQCQPDFYAVSQAGVKWLHSIGVEAKGVLHNSVDPAFIQSCLNQPAIKQPDTLIYAGRLIAEKGIRELLAAFCLLKQTRPQIRLHIAGTGPLEKEVRKIPGVICHGRLEQETLFSLMASCSVMVLPSYSEGFPTSVLEAMICKTKTAATPVGGILEMIPDENFGFILESLDPEHIKEILEKALDRQGDFAMETNAFKRVLENFTWEIQAQKLEEIEWEKANC